jgi:hypothetical protein
VSGFGPYVMQFLIFRHRQVAFSVFSRSSTEWGLELKRFGSVNISVLQIKRDMVSAAK